MRRYRLQGMSGRRFDVTQRAVAHPFLLAGSTFVLGLATGMVLKDTARQMFERSRNGLWHRDYDRTVEYDNNLPESLARREPPPVAGQPRFGGTGALGVSPAAVRTATPEERK